MIDRVHHVSFNVKNLQPMIDFYSQLGFEIFRTAFNEERKTRLDLLRSKDGGAFIEFISPTSWDSHLSQVISISSRGAGLGHVALSVDNVEAEFTRLRQYGV